MLLRRSKKFPHPLSYPSTHYLCIISILFTKVPSKREREQEAEVPQKVQKILGATSVSGTRIFETIAEKCRTGLGEKVRTLLRESGVVWLAGEKVCTSLHESDVVWLIMY